jgi:hypothetical protein
MATDAPSVVARIVSSTHQAPPHLDGERDLRAILYSEDADALWSELHRFVQAAGIPLTGNCETITQDLFLQLLSVKDRQPDAGDPYTDEELRLELFAALERLTQANS